MARLTKLCVLALLLAQTFVASAQRPAADVIIMNARVWTVDRERPRAEAVAIIHSRIVAVGTNAEIDNWRGEKTQVIDGFGKLLLPGFNDAHVHFVSGGMQLDQVDLKDADNPEEFKRRIAARAKRTQKGEWILGGDWDEQRWATEKKPATLPTKKLVDSAAGDIPVFVNRYDGHMGLANSAALRIAGITRQTKNPPGGEIVRDSNGDPTGILKDAAMNLVAEKIPRMTRSRRTAAVRRALQHAAKLGVTSVQDMGSDPEDISVYAELEEKGELTARVYAAVLIANWADEAKVGMRRSFGSSYLRVGALKGYADGSLGSSTAYMFEPFADEPKNQGLLAEDMQPVEKMRERLLKSDAGGLQSCVHAIGDQAISMTLDLFADVQKTNGPGDRRQRVEHAQHMAQKDFKRFADLNVIASVQPYHAIDDGRWAETRLGPERAKTTYAFKTFLDSGVRLALGTDWNVAPLNPMLTVYAAATRATLDGKQPEGWVPEQKIKVADAVEAYTMGSAYAEFQEKEKGSITPGKLADMVLLSDDIFAIRPDTIKDVTVELTVVGGKVVYRKHPE